MHRGKPCNPFFACCFHGFSPKEWVTSMRLWLDPFGYTVASQSILKRYTCILCAVSNWIPPGEKCQGYRKQVWLLFTTRVLFVSLVLLVVRWLWCLGRVHSCLYAQTPHQHHPSGRLTPTSQIKSIVDCCNQMFGIIVLFEGSDIWRISVLVKTSAGPR